MILDELIIAKDTLELAIEDDIGKRIKAFKEETGCDVSSISISFCHSTEYGLRNTPSVVQNVSVEIKYKELTII